MTEQHVEISHKEKVLGEEILEIGANLIDIKDEDLTRLDERRFVAVFLPMFANDEVQPYINHGANITTWRKLAGGAHKEVVIFDAASNAELYRVPPLFDFDAISPMTGKEREKGLTSISDMLARANLIAKQGQRAYDSFVETELQKRAFIFGDKKNETEYIARWNAIFQRYKRPLIDLSVAAATANQPDTNGTRKFDNDDFDPIDG